MGLLRSAQLILSLIFAAIVIVSINIISDSVYYLAKGIGLGYNKAFGEEPNRETVVNDSYKNSSQTKIIANSLVNKTSYNPSDYLQRQCSGPAPIDDTKASESQLNFPSSNVQDKDFRSRWSSNGVGQWIQLDLGTSENICSIDINWYKGDERQYHFVISASNDGIAFSTIYDNKSEGITRGSEKYDFDDINARYIRVTVNGNTKDNNASITEISVNVISNSSDYVIGAAGDWGSSRNDNWKKTVKLMRDNKVDLTLGLGDYSYDRTKDFEKVVDRLEKADILMRGSKGDHDKNSYAKLFGQPSLVFAFDAGAARIILLGPNKAPSSNAEFLEKELNATKQPWKIVTSHIPLYTSPSVNDEDKSMAKALQPILDKYEVDLVMWADNHNYERIKFPDKHTVFIQSGTGGESHYKFDGQRKESMYQNDKDFGITKLTINNTALSGQFISHSGKVLDSFILTK